LGTQKIDVVGYIINNACKFLFQIVVTQIPNRAEDKPKCLIGFSPSKGIFRTIAAFVEGAP
jgi:hypothetical protein